VGKVNAALLDNTTVGQYAADTATAFRPLPTVTDKRCLAIDRFQPLTNALLKTDEVVLDGLDIRLL
jgi:hypothetical protein